MVLLDPFHHQVRHYSLRIRLALDLSGQLLAEQRGNQVDVFPVALVVLQAKDVFDAVGLGTEVLHF